MLAYSYSRCMIHSQHMIPSDALRVKPNTIYSTNFLEVLEKALRETETAMMRLPRMMAFILSEVARIN